MEQPGEAETVFAQMINIVEDVPQEWREDWEEKLEESQVHEFIRSESHPNVA